MASTKQVLASLGDDEQTFSVESLGKVWQISMPDQVVIGEYEEWLEDEARNALERRRGRMTLDAYSAEGARLDAASAGGDYLWGGPMFTAVIAKPRGSNKLLALMLGVRHQGMTVEQAKEILVGNPQGVRRAYRSALYTADPLLFSPLASETEEGKTTTDQDPPPGDESISTSA